MNILFLHGALASKSQFDAILPLLPKEYHAHTLNFSGHGGKAIPLGGFRFETFCADILSYMDEHKLDRVHLFGYSMGGYAALMFASLHPERVNKVFTLNVKFNWDAESTLKETNMLDPEKMLEKVPGFANNLMVQHGLAFWKDMLKSTSDMMTEMTIGKVLQEEDYRKISAPCLLGIGEKDKTSSLTETMDVHAKIANAQLLVIPGAPHPFEKISPQRIVFELQEFLK